MIIDKGIATAFLESARQYIYISLKKRYDRQIIKFVIGKTALIIAAHQFSSISRVFCRFVSEITTDQQFLVRRCYTQRMRK